MARKAAEFQVTASNLDSSRARHDAATQRLNDDIAAVRRIQGELAVLSTDQATLVRCHRLPLPNRTDVHSERCEEGACKGNPCSVEVATRNWSITFFLPKSVCYHSDNSSGSMRRCGSDT